MSKQIKIFIGIGLTIMVLVGLYLFANHYAKSKIEGLLEENFSKVSYEDISVNVLSGSATISGLHLESIKATIKASRFQLKDLSYYKYFFNEKLVIDELNFQDLVIVHQKKDSVAGENSASQKGSFQKNVLIQNLNISGGSYKLIEQDSSSKLFISLQEVGIKKLTRKSKAQQSKVPFEYEEADIKTDSVYYDMNPEHYITIKDLRYLNRDLIMNNLHIVPRYDRNEFDQKISVEKDRIELWVNKSKAKNFEWNFINDTIQLSTPYFSIENADLKIYRNKLLPDDNRPRPLYSKMLREMGAKVQIDSVNVKGSSITYEEKTSRVRPAGKLVLKDLTADIKNITNVELDRKDFPETTIMANASLAGKAPLTLNWSFTVPGKEDKFHVSGNFGTLNAETINSFLVPVLNVKAEGHINSLYFNFYGNSYSLSGDLKMSYDNFKIKVLEKDENDKNWLKSTIANFLIKNDVVNDEVEQVQVEVERDVTKSFWNFLWSAIRTGIKETATKF